MDAKTNAHQAKKSNKKPRKVIRDNCFTKEQIRRAGRNPFKPIEELQEQKILQFTKVNGNGYKPKRKKVYSVKKLIRMIQELLEKYGNGKNVEFSEEVQSLYSEAIRTLKGNEKFPEKINKCKEAIEEAYQLIRQKRKSMEKEE